MFEPARLWTGLRPAAPSAAAIIPAVVVLPLVALTIVEPSLSRPPRRAIASGARRSSSRPGSVVPPPRPLRRLSAPIAREPARLALKPALTVGAGAITRSARRSRRSFAGRSVRCSPSA